MVADKEQERVAAELLRRRLEAGPSSNVELRHAGWSSQARAYPRASVGRGQVEGLTVRGGGGGSAPSSSDANLTKQRSSRSGGGGAGTTSRGPRNTSARVPSRGWSSESTQPPRWLFSCPTCPTSSADAAGGNGKKGGEVFVRRPRVSLQHQADVLARSVDALSTADHDFESPKQSSTYRLPSAKSRLANGMTRLTQDALNKGAAVDPAPAPPAAAARAKPKPLRWNDTWGPGASTVPPDQDTQPKGGGFDVQQTMVPAFDGFVTAAASSWGGREKNKWKKENQDTFIMSPGCKREKGWSNDGDAAASGPEHGRRSNRHSTGSTSPIPGLGPGLAGDSCTCLLAVLDGHGSNGRHVSTFVRDHLLRDLCEEVDLSANRGTNLFAGTSAAGTRAAEATVVAACRRADYALRTVPGDRDVRLSGSTCALAVVSPHAVLTACVGDSRVVLGRVRDLGKPARGGSGGAVSSHANGNGSSPSASAAMAAAVRASGLEAVALTRDHKPEDPRECARILAANGRVARLKTGSGLEVGPLRVFLKYSWTPGLAVSRAFGDVLAHEVGVTSEPEVATHALQEGDRLLVLASDGVWEHLTDQQVIDVAAQAGGYHPTAAVASFDAAAAARAVCAAARVAWTQQSAAAVDDITAVVAYLTHAVQSEASQEPAIIDGNYGVNGGARPARMSLKTEVSWHLAR